MSIVDIKHSLRKYEFPQCAKEALGKIEQILAGRNAPSTKQLDGVMEVISEFIFCETDRRGGRRNGSALNPLQELQLIDIICEYLSGNINETAKNTIFLSLFGGTEGQRRLKILSILASMAISASSTPMLLAVGVWLQQMGCSSPQSLQLAENVIRDHFHLSTNVKSLKCLSNVAPHFVANFITAVTELYMREVNGVVKLPPKNLLEIITYWVYYNPTLCMSAQMNPAALPNGAIPMAAVTPIAGLIYWCSLAPLYLKNEPQIQEEPLPAKKIKLEFEHNVAPIQKIPNKTLTEAQLYEKLQVGVLTCLRAGKKSPAAVNAQHLLSILPPIHQMSHQLLSKGVNLATHKQLQDCLDRIGQSVQVALANGCVYGNLSNLFASLSALPENRLIGIIQKMHQQTI